MRRFDRSGRPGKNRFSNNRKSSRPQRPRRHFKPQSRTQPLSESAQNFLKSAAVDPSPRIQLEQGSSELTMRMMDLITPIGFGQRGLIVAPPGSGKTTILRHLCDAIVKSCPDAKVYCLLIDERPEEVTDFRRNVSAEVRHSSTDETYDNHIRVADELMQQAYTEAGNGADVVVLIDSLTRLSRIHNAGSRSTGRTLSGGVDARALEVPRRIFGSARKTEDLGSLTILATILIETGSRMDDVIFEEFKGTGNMEIVLSREISGRRVFPAIDIQKSGTRRIEKLLPPDDLEKVNKIRRELVDCSTVEAAELLIQQLKRTDTNREILDALKI